MDTPARPTRLKRLWHWLREDSAWPFFRVAGSMLFFWGMAAFELTWATWNSIAPPEWRFDQFPTFPVMLLLGNQVQLFYLPILQSAQMMLNRQDEQRRQRDAQILEAMMTLIETQKATVSRSWDVIQEMDREADDRFLLTQTHLAALDQRLARIETAVGLADPAREEASRHDPAES